MMKNTTNRINLLKTISTGYHKLRKNKEYRPKHKPISTNTLRIEKSRVKLQNQLEKSVKQKTHTCNLTISSYTRDLKREHGVFGRERV